MVCAEVMLEVNVSYYNYNHCNNLFPVNAWLDMCMCINKLSMYVCMSYSELAITFKSLQLLHTDPLFQLIK